MSSTDLQSRLDALVAARKEREHANAKYAAEAALVREIEREEQLAVDDAGYQDCVAQYGAHAIERVSTTYGDIVVRRPNHLIFKRFQDEAKADSEAYMRLVRPSVVYPDKDRFDAILVEQPGALSRCANAVARLAGFLVSEVAKK